MFRPASTLGFVGEAALKTLPASSTRSAARRRWATSAATDGLRSASGSKVARKAFTSPQASASCRIKGIQLRAAPPRSLIRCNAAAASSGDVRCSTTGSQAAQATGWLIIASTSAPADEASARPEIRPVMSPAPRANTAASSPSRSWTRLSRWRARDMNTQSRARAIGGSSSASRPAISARNPSKSFTKLCRCRQDTFDWLVSSDPGRLSTSTARCSAPCAAASSMRRWRFSSDRPAAAAISMSASRWVPSAFRFSELTLFRLATVGRFMVGSKPRLTRQAQRPCRPTAQTSLHRVSCAPCGG